MSTSRTREKADGELFKSTGIDDNATSTAVTIDASENVGIGTASPSSKLTSESATGTNIVAKSTNGNGGYYNYQGLSSNGTQTFGVNHNGTIFTTSGLAVGGTGAANTLDDYEEGTWTPTIVGTTSAGTGTYGQQNGSYTKVGRQVSFQLFITLSAHTGTGFIQINGLPFNSLAAPNYHTVYFRIETIAMTAGNYIQGYIIAGDAKIALEQVPTGGGGAVSIPIDPAMSIIVSGTYAT
jgi:hypothetical protein